TVLYTLFDVLLLSAVIRLAVGSGRRSTSYFMLLGSAACAGLVDIFVTIATFTSGAASGAALSGVSQRLTLIASPLAYVFAAAAGLHPSVAHLTDGPQIRDIQLSPKRLTVLFSAVVGMVILLFVA